MPAGFVSWLFLKIDLSFVSLKAPRDLLTLYDEGPYHIDWFLYDRDLRHERVKILSNSK